MSKKGSFPVHVILVVCLVIVYIPICYMILISLVPPELLFDSFIPQGLTLGNYAKVLSDSEMLSTYRNSWIIGSSTVVVTLILASLGGYGLSRHPFKGRVGFIFLILATQMLPMELLAIGYFPILKGLHLINRKAGLVLLHSTITIPFCTLILKSVFDGIPREMEEAAKIDGCSSIGSFLRVVLPSCTGGLIAAATFAFLQSWAEYFYALIFTSDLHAMPVTVELSRLTGHYYVSWETIMALSFVTMVPVLVLFTVFQRYLLKGLARGAIKF